MRRISTAQAARCETALGGRCRCRCLGAFHGAARVADPVQLPATDPHSPRRRTATWQQLALDLQGAA